MEMKHRGNKLPDDFKDNHMVRPAIILTILAVLLSGLYLRFEWHRHQDAASREAIQLAQSMESLLHTEYIAGLSGGPEDLENPEYHIVKRSLLRLVETTNPIHFAYIWSKNDGGIIFLMDSEPLGSPDYSPPGQVYSEAQASDWKPFLSGEAVLTEPLTDRWGTWISALVPISDPRNGEIIAVFGIDYSAAEWRASLFKRMIPETIIVFVILILFFTLLHIWFQNLRIRKIGDRLTVNEALYRNVFEQAPVGIAIVSDKSFVSESKMGRVTINPIFERILDRTSHDLANLEWTDITHPEDLQKDIQKFDLFKRGETAGYSMEKRFVRPDGSSVWTNMKVSPLLGLPYRHTMHLCLLEDISARKAVEDQLIDSERSKTVFISNMPGLAYRCNYDREWTMQFVSEGCFNLTGYASESLIHNNELSYKDLIAPEYRESIWKELSSALKAESGFESEYEIMTASGERKWVLERAEGVYDKQGEVEAIEGIILDISDRKKSEEQLRRLLERTQSMIENHQAVMLLVEPLSGRIIEANAAATSFYGYSKGELLEMTIQDINTLDKDEITALRTKALNKEQKYFTFPHRLKNGEIRFVDVCSSPIDHGGQKILFSIIFDVTKREEIAKQNEFMAYHCHLTGLYNRRFFEEDFERRVKKGDFPVAILLGNLDGFRMFNDAFGRVEGDEVLKTTAKRLKALINDGDVLARVGGDEFAIIVTGKNEVDIRQYLDKLNQEFDSDYENFEIDEIDEVLTMSWGYGFQRHKEDSLDKLYKDAETFMRNRKFYSDRSARSKLVDVIMGTLFAKSKREKDHSERVGELCRTIARELKLSKSEVDKIRVAGLLHDIGKIGIDETILNKPGKLGAAEWELMKLHSAKGSAILEKTTEYNDIADIVLLHHERYDGFGYPHGLKSDAIPLGARIIAIADAFDTMTSERTYKVAMEKEEAREEIRSCSGTHFDPEIVSVFINKIMV